MDCTQQHNTPVGIIYSDLLGKLTWCADDPAQTNAGVNPKNLIEAPKKLN